MLKLRADDLILFGLSDENLRRLKLGQPIKFDGAQVNLPGLTFVIIHGETEAAMERSLIDAGLRIPQ